MNKNIQAIYSLSPLQEGILYHTIEEPNSDIYFQQFSCIIENMTEPQKWQECWQKVTQAHPILRTLFTWENRPKPLQIVRERVSILWTTLDWSTLSDKEQKDRWNSLIQRDRDLGFDLSVAPLTRFTLINISNNRFKFLFSFHHIILDGWSQRLLFDQAEAFYNNPPPPTLSQQGYLYSNFIDWLNTQDKEHAKAFWTEQLAGFEQPTNIVNDTLDSQAKVSLNKRNTVELALDSATLTQLNTQAKKHHLTLNTLVLGAWSLILASHNQTHDVVFGTTVAGRAIDLPHADKVVGLFINTLPCRIQINKRQSLANWLAYIQSNQAACRQFEQTPLADIHRYSDLAQGRSLFESIVVFENLPTEQAGDSYSQIKITAAEYSEFSHYPLAILVDPSEGLNLIAVFQESKISKKRAQEVLQQLQIVLVQMSNTLEKTVSKIKTYPDELLQNYLKNWNQTQVNFSDTPTVNQMFEKWAADKPNTTALIDITGQQQRAFSYQELNTKANQLAHFLMKKGLGPNHIVPVLMQRSAQSLITFLAVIKTGSAYIPLDSEQPKERQQAIMSTLGDKLKFIISESALVHKISLKLISPLLIDEHKTDIENSPENNLRIDIKLNQLAYVIYTSGSTGTPKGVMIAHSALTNSTLARNHFYPKSPDTFLLLSSFATDSSIAGIFWTLCTGGALLLPSKGIEQNMLLLGNTIQDYDVTHTLCIPSLHQLILENIAPSQLTNIDTVIVAGENCNRSVVQAHQELIPYTELYNEYGPSETCVWATASRLTQLQPFAELPIGEPIANTQIYVLDPEHQLVPSQVTGELYIGGSNLAKGYLSQPEKTAEVFIPNPFSEHHDTSLLYKTGDLVRYNDDGQLIFVGRADNQIKVRGFRVEPEEIEHVLTSHPSVKEALVYLQPPAVSDTALINALLTLAPLEANTLLDAIDNDLNSENQERFDDPAN